MLHNTIEHNHNMEIKGYTLLKIRGNINLTFIIEERRNSRKIHCRISIEL
jgi:hypothetical protein